MKLGRTAALLTSGLTLTLLAGPALAHEEHVQGPPGQNKDQFPITCEGVAGELLIEVTSANRGRGVGRIIEGDKGVLIPTTAVFEVRNETTDETLFSDTEEFTKGQRKMQGTTCRLEFFRGTLEEVAAEDPDFADELRASGADEDDVISAGATIQALLRGPVAGR